jgi:acyl carrier protein
LQQVLLPSAALLELAAACVMNMLTPDGKLTAVAAADEQATSSQAAAASSSKSLQSIVFAAPVRLGPLTDTVVVSCVVSADPGLFWVQSSGNNVAQTHIAGSIGAVNWGRSPLRLAAGQPDQPDPVAGRSSSGSTATEYGQELTAAAAALLFQQQQEQLLLASSDGAAACVAAAGVSSSSNCQGLLSGPSEGFLVHPAVLEASLQMQALCIRESAEPAIAGTPAVVGPAAIRHFLIPASPWAQLTKRALQFSGLLRQPREGGPGSSMHLFDINSLAAAVIDAEFRPLVLEAAAAAAVVPPVGSLSPTAAASRIPAARQLSSSQVTILVQSTVEAVLGQSVGSDAPLMATGLDSLGATEVRNGLQSSLGLDLPATLTFDYPTVAAISGFIQQQLQPAAEASGAIPSQRRAMLKAAVAAARPLLVTGQSSPQRSIQEYAAGVDAVSLAPYWRWDIDSHHSQLAGTAEVQPRFGVFLSGVDLFDCTMYGITPLEASTLDPQQRLLLHAASEALQSSFTTTSQTSANVAAPCTGCFVGIGTNDYEVLASNAGVSVSAFSFTAASAAVASGRLAFVYDLHGPSASIDTACSASLVALHMAAASLADGSADAALVAGVLLCLVPQSTMMVQKAGMLAGKLSTDCLGMLALS